jgi:hypothetical protein
MVLAYAVARLFDAIVYTSGRVKLAERKGRVSKLERKGICVISNLRD